MTAASRSRASRGFVLSLVFVSGVALATIALWTRGASPLLRVEARIAELDAVARGHGVPADAFLALSWYDARRDVAREDAARASALATALRAHGGDVEAAFARLIRGEVQRRMALDLMRRKATRWRRMRAS